MMRHGMRRIAESEEERAENQRRVIYRLIRRLRPYWMEVAGAFFFVILNAGAQAMGPILIGRATDRFIAMGDKRGLASTMLILAGVYLVSMLAIRFQIYLMSKAGQHVLADLRLAVFDKLQSLSLQYIEREETGDLMSRLVNDIDAINSFISQGFIQAIGAVFSLLGIMIGMFALNVPLALAALSIVPVMILTTGKFSTWSRRAFRKTRETIGDVSADLQEELEGVKVAQAFSRGQENIANFEARNASNRDANVSATAVTSAFSPAMDLLSTLDVAIVAGLGGYLAIRGAVTVGVVVSFLQYVGNFTRPVRTVSQMWTLAQSSLAAGERIFDLIDTEEDIKDREDAVELTSIQGQVRFEEGQDGEGVTFGYDPQQPVLKDVRFTTKPGQTVAFVGPTGAGKSTLISLIPRFYEVTQGKISVDGIEIRDVTQKSLRDQISMVLQEPFLFSGSVKENICYGDQNASEEEITAAAEAANAHDFITRLPEGYQTQVGERGGMLSQGQRQLISIARAILADPRILILDEATSSVDTRTETLIQAALDRLLSHRTSFIIAHRLSTVRNADIIYVLAEGEIVEQGSHTELLNRGGMYAELYKRQFFVPPELNGVKEN
ncbi:MAG: ABC transporter ATP-binding protein [Anaerolineales bacterium]|nr:ABC transporter ATP-binding protein [Anaerolineales bacterium]MBS3753328.1 ABC transporter ATP-binding protein [Anaerolineales bacterium]